VPAMMRFEHVPLPRSPANTTRRDRAASPPSHRPSIEYPAPLPVTTSSANTRLNGVQ
jgi:hypothetical protein